MGKADQARHRSPVRRGTGAGRKRKKKNDTFGGVCETYFTIKLARQRSGPLVEKRFRKHLFPIFKDRPITEITDLDILGKVVNPRAAKTPEMARQLFNDLNTFFAWVIDQRTYTLKLNPCASIKIAAIVGERPLRRRILN